MSQFRSQPREAALLVLVCLLLLAYGCGGGGGGDPVAPAAAGAGSGSTGGGGGSGVGGGGGGGTPPPTHLVILNWDASPSQVAGYNVYRGDQVGGPYTKLNGALIPGLTFTDNTVVSGRTYFYVATSVDSSQVEGASSNEAPAVIPTP